jgi:hypothetical protein
MSGSFDTDALSRRISLVMTLLLFTGGLGIAVWLDRAYERWWAMNEPLAGLRRGHEKRKANRRRRWGNAADFTKGLGELTTELRRQEQGHS